MIIVPEGARPRCVSIFVRLEHLRVGNVHSHPPFIPAFLTRTPSTDFARLRVIARSPRTWRLLHGLRSERPAFQNFDRTPWPRRVRFAPRWQARHAAPRAQRSTSVASKVITGACTSRGPNAILVERQARRRRTEIVFDLQQKASRWVGRSEHTRCAMRAAAPKAFDPAMAASGFLVLPPFERCKMQTIAQLRRAGQMRKACHDATCSRRLVGSVPPMQALSGSMTMSLRSGIAMPPARSSGSHGRGPVDPAARAPHRCRPRHLEPGQDGRFGLSSAETIRT